MADKAAGWYPEPGGAAGKFRWWDGAHWTDAVSETLWAPEPRNSRPYVPAAPVARSSPSAYARSVDLDDLDGRGDGRRGLLIGGAVLAGVVLVVAVVLLVVLRAPGGEPVADDDGAASGAPSTSPTDRSGPSAGSGASGPPRSGPPTAPASAPASNPAPPPADPQLPQPELPAAASRLSDAGAKAFVRHYFQALSYGDLTGDFGPARKLAVPGCRMCNELTSTEPKSNPHLTRVVVAGQAFPEIAGKKVKISVQVKMPADTYRPSPSAKATPRKAEQWWYDVSAEHTGAGWKVTSIA